MLLHHLALFIVWPAFGLLYFGLTLALGKINSTSYMHLSFILIDLIEIPAEFIMDILGAQPPNLMLDQAPALQVGTCDSKNYGQVT